MKRIILAVGVLCSSLLAVEFEVYSYQVCEYRKGCMPKQELYPQTVRMDSNAIVFNNGPLGDKTYRFTYVDYVDDTLFSATSMYYTWVYNRKLNKLKGHSSLGFMEWETRKVRSRK